MYYKFECKNCGEFEIKLKMSEVPLKQCPHCGGQEVQRVFDSGILSIWKTDGAHSKSYHRKDNT